MAKKQSFFGYSDKEVAQMEAALFYIQFGGDAVAEEGYYLFTKAEAKRVYNKMLKDLVGIVADGNPKDKQYALDLIMGFVVKPMRLH